MDLKMGLNNLGGYRPKGYVNVKGYYHAAGWERFFVKKCHILSSKELNVTSSNFRATRLYQ
jgi:hypothetical protein